MTQYPKKAHISDAPGLEYLLNLDEKINHATIPKNTRRTPIRIAIMRDGTDAILVRRFLEGQENGERITLKSMGDEIGLAESTVSIRLKAIRQQWRESSIRDWETLTQHKLAELDALKEEAWAAWHESKKDAIEYKESSSEHDGTKKSTTIKGQTGNVAYLAEINRCIQQEIDLLGLEAPKEVHVLTWEDKIVKYLKEGRVTVESLSEYMGEDEARAFAKKAGILLESGE